MIGPFLAPPLWASPFLVPPLLIPPLPPRSRYSFPFAVFLVSESVPRSQRFCIGCQVWISSSQSETLLKEGKGKREKRWGLFELLEVIL